MYTALHLHGYWVTVAVTYVYQLLFSGKG